MAHSGSRTGFAAAWTLVLAASAGFVGLAAVSVETSPATTIQKAPAMCMVPPGAPEMLYNGNGSCNTKQCHGGESSAPKSGRQIGDEGTIWDSGDPHGHAYKSLSKRYESPTGIKTKDMMEKLGIESATKDLRCLSCHGNNPSKDAAGELQFTKDAVGCESCHGPSEKYKDPHEAEGWTDKKRAELGSGGLLKDFGLFDTSDLSMRTGLCISCHLSIDKDMIDAGHPALSFEFYQFNHYRTNDAHRQHWQEGASDSDRDARLWALGQVAGLQSATSQKSAWAAKSWDTAIPEAWISIYSAGTTIAKEHLGADTVAGLAKAAISADQAKAASAALLAAASGFKDGETLSDQRTTLASGMEALVLTASGMSWESRSEAYKAAFAIAASGKGGDEWLKAMTDLQAFSAAK